MQDLIDDLDLINYKTTHDTMGCMVDHIHLDNSTFSILSNKGIICGALLIILFDSDCVHIYVNYEFNFTKQQGSGLTLVSMLHLTYTYASPHKY
jgi:hypothetical protein